MLFNSMHFLFFFLAVTLLFFALPVRFRWIWMLIASYYFYMCWEPIYIVLILFTTAVTYVCGVTLSRAVNDRGRKLIVLGGLGLSLSLLFLFKYFNFFVDSLGMSLAYLRIPASLPILHVLLPVGISFYTFQGIGYIIDVYRGHIAAERNPGRLALFLILYPQLVAGPIERACNLLPQMSMDQGFDIGRAADGVRLMMWGLFKKVVIADRLAMYVDAVYNNVGQHTGPTYLLATYLFAFQIYCDFSGYTDIAIGAARVLGIDLMQNFRRPYFATTISDFWRRWHISLSTWLRDYLYIPLGGSRLGVSRTYVNLMITMVLGGIWHGAAWTFVIWGLLQGVMLCLSRATLPYRDRLVARLQLPIGMVTAVRMLATFHLVCLSWVFFRANSAQDAWYLLTHLRDGWPRVFVEPLSLGCGIPALLVLLVVQLLQAKGPVLARVKALPVPARWSLYIVTVFAIILFGVDSGSQFIYFQF